MRDHYLRSASKALSWRFFGTLDTFILSFLVIHFLGPLFGADVAGGGHVATAKTAGYIALAEVVTKITLFFLHERGWAHIAWGRADSGGRRRDRARRSLAKTASWRMLASLDTFLLALIFTGDAKLAASIGGLEVISKLILYYLHERLWDRIGAGAGRAG